MPDPNLIRQRRKNYRTAIEGVVGTNLFRHIYVVDKRDGREFDALEDGQGACAYVVSGVLALHGLIDRPHATVQTTVEKLLEAGWRETKKPVWGDIVHWPAHNDHMHIGFYIDRQTVVSNSVLQRTPIKHHPKLHDGRLPVAYYTHDMLHLSE
ncbi:MAG TPA: hypothetical protein VLA88_02260 [Candidatus Saccharimonadales bacterium]|nr:hypothetical protein [Candidatus Saccharimonadales bacterium]